MRECEYVTEMVSRSKHSLTPNTGATFREDPSKVLTMRYAWKREFDSHRLRLWAEVNSLSLMEKKIPEFTILAHYGPVV